jgi:DNA-binding response OmpR family regulator
MAQIFVLEDLEDSFLLMKHGIDSSHEVIWAKTVAEGKKLFSESVDLAIVDVTLPDGDGFEFCNWIRQNMNYNSIPVMFASANQAVESRVTGLILGGDDYIVKPFHLAELKARIESKLRYKQAREKKDICLQSFGVTLNLKSRKVFITEQSKNQNIELTPIEFKILHYLMEEPGRVCERDAILNQVWGSEVYVYPRSVDTHVSKLRKKLGSKSNLIHAVHGSGYRYGEHAAS